MVGMAVLVAGGGQRGRCRGENPTGALALESRNLRHFRASGGDDRAQGWRRNWV